jgi:hypothetical protein
VQAEASGWQIIAGQTWSLFGWTPNFVLASESIAPDPGTAFQRVPQFTVIKQFLITEENKIFAGVSALKPAQIDSSFPSVDAGIRWVWLGRAAGFSGATGEIKAQPLSLGVSGRASEFYYLNDPTNNTSGTHLLGSAIAINAFVPLLATADQKTVDHTLAVAGEYTRGRGYAEVFPGFTGGIGPYVSGKSGKLDVLPSGTNVDGGQVGLDPGLGIQLLHLQSWNLQAQYHLPEQFRTFITAGYGQLWADNVDTMTGEGLSADSIVNRSEIYFTNLFHNWTSQIRTGVELGQSRTTYSDTVVSHNNRIQFSAYFFF